jgi:hypothetical protein
LLGSLSRKRVAKSLSSLPKSYKGECQFSQKSFGESAVNDQITRSEKVISRASGSRISRSAKGNGREFKKSVKTLLVSSAEEED